jgi:hypothetical protein
MARVARTAAALPIIGSVVAAVALTGVAVFTVADSGCPSPGHYVQQNGQFHLVGGCVSAEQLRQDGYGPATGPGGGTVAGAGNQQSRP